MTGHSDGWIGTVSVVVPTHNRPASLLRLLRALAQPGGVLPHEVVIVADGCTPETAQAVAAEPLPYPVRVFEQHPARGPALSRNRGAAETTGDVLLFIDDDIEPFENVVGEHRRHHDGTPRVVIGAPVAPRQPDEGFRDIESWGWWEQQFEHMREPGCRFTYEDLTTGILSVPRELWMSAGGLDETLSVFRCREDFELGLRLLRQRVEFAFTESGGGWHHENRKGARLIDRKEKEGAADVTIARLHPWAFPALRLLAWEATQPGGSIVRRLAFRWPRTSRLITAVAERMLDVLESLRLRGTWRRVMGGMMYIAYWRGAARALGSWEALDVLADQAMRTPLPDRRELRIDLAADLESLRHQLDDHRPDALHLFFEELPLGVIHTAPGREPWRGAHLDSPPRELVDAVMVARALAELRACAPTVPGLSRNMAA